MNDSYSPITKGSTCCPAVLYHGGLPAVYIVRFCEVSTDSETVFLMDWFVEEILCRAATLEPKND